jgi:hypothetical protein
LQIRSAATKPILHDCLGLRKITCRLVPHFLTEAQKQDHVDYCLEMLKAFDGGESKCVYDIITGDESWFYYYDPELMQQSQVWVTSNGPPPATVLRQPCVGKHMFTIFFIKSSFNTAIPRANGKTTIAKWFTHESLLNGLKQAEKH